MINPFIHAGRTVRNVVRSAGQTDFFDPTLGRMVVIPFTPLIFIGAFAQAFTISHDKQDPEEPQL